VGSIRSRLGRLISVFAVTTVAMGTVIVAAPQAQAGVGPFTLKALSWYDIGLDSNDVTAGPNVYEIGIRACNTGTTTATTVTATWAWTNVGRDRTGVALATSYVDIQTGTSATQVTHYLAAGACFDFYFNLEIVRDAAAYKTTRNFTVTVEDTIVGEVSSASLSNRIAIMDIQSQARNYVFGTHCDGQPDGTKDCGVYGPWNVGTGSWDPAPTAVLVGGTYTYTLISTTATAGYGSYSTMLNFPRGIFQIQSVTQAYKTFPATPNAYCCRDIPPNVNGTVTRLWNNACNWQYDATDPVADDCTTGAEKLDKSGNTTVTTFVIKILAAGTSSITGLVWDGSGASWHYNADYGTQVISITATKPTAVSFGSASAIRARSGNVVEWDTASETDNLGFNVYATEGDQKVKLNEGLIAGSALSTGDAGVGVGRSYRWVVPASRTSPSDEYWIEAVDLNGDSTWHGPVKVSGSSSAAVSRSSAPLSSLADGSGRSFSEPRVSSGAAVIPAAAASLAGSPAVKIGISHEGWYRVPLSDVASAGLTVGDPNGLRLYAEGVEQPIEIRDGAVEFYGLGLDTPSTDTRVYWLTNGSPGGARIVTQSPSAGPAGPGSYAETVARQDRNIYFSSLVNGDAGNFFGAPVLASGVDQTITADALASAAGATLQVNLQGVSAGPHSVGVKLNGNTLGVVTFTDKGHGSATFPASGLVDGDNVVRLASSGAPDVSLVDSLRLTYQRILRARSGSLRFTAAGGTSSTIHGFGSDGVRVVDVTDPRNPAELTTTTASDGGGGFDATVTAAGSGQRTLFAFGSPRSPDSLQLNKPSSLRIASNRPGMIIVAPPSLMASMLPLAAYHNAHGLRTRIVDVTDVYDEFGAGEKSPQALKNFLTSTYRSLGRAPRYVLLAGDGSLDPRGYMGPAGKAADLLPTKTVDTEFMETVSDTWFADVNGDLRPDFSLGRFPVRTPAEADALVAKTIAYGSSAPRRSVVVATDVNDSFDFSAAGRSVARFAPSGWGVTSVEGASPTARTDLLSAIDAGPSVINYIGHGNVDLWRGGLLTSADAPDLTNASHPAFFVATTCLNGYFQDPNLDSLSEAMLKAPGGAVVAWSSTGMTYPSPQVKLNQALYKALSSARNPSIGSATVDASRSTSDQDVLKTWTLLGDPAVVLR